MTNYLHNPILVVLTFLGFHGIILAMLLFFKKGNPIANRILAFKILIFSVTLLIHSFTSSTGIDHPRHHSRLLVIFIFLFGPILFLYVYSLTEDLSKFEKKSLNHFIPFFCIALYWIPTIIILKPIDFIPVLHRAVIILGIIHIFFYIFRSIKILRIYQIRIKNSFSHIERINLKWLAFLIIAYSLVWIYFSILQFLFMAPQNLIYFWLLVAIVIYTIGIFTFKQPEIFSAKKSNLAPESNQSKNKYKKSSLTEERSTVHLNRLIEKMKQDKPYLNGDLTLSGLAGALSIPIHHLSQIINERLKVNFFDFVNQYRAEEAKTMLESKKYDHLCLADIGFEAGFNSVSTFNKSFKKKFKSPPSEHQKALKSRN